MRASASAQGRERGKGEITYEDKEIDNAAGIPEFVVVLQRWSVRILVLGGCAPPENSPRR